MAIIIWTDPAGVEHPIREDTRLSYRTWGGAIRHIVVEQVFADIKNGRPGFDGVMASTCGSDLVGEFVWGYLDQIVAVH